MFHARQSLKKTKQKLSNLQEILSENWSIKHSIDSPDRFYYIYRDRNIWTFKHTENWWKEMFGDIENMFDVGLSKGLLTRFIA